MELREILSGKVISDWTPKRRQSLPKQPVLRQTASGSPELDGGVFLSTGYLPAGPVSCSGEGEKKKGSQQSDDGKMDRLAKHSTQKEMLGQQQQKERKKEARKQRKKKKEEEKKRKKRPVKYVPQVFSTSELRQAKKSMYSRENTERDFRRSG